MLGLDLDSWNNLLSLFLGIGALAAVAVGVSQYIVIQLQREDARVANERLSANEAETARAHAESAQANERAANLENETESLRSENLKLEATIAPRRITEDGCNRIVEALKPFSGRRVEVASYVMDAESAVLGVQILSCLQMAGVIPVERLMSITPMGSITFGIVVNGPNRKLENALRGSLQQENLGVLAPGASFARGNAAIVVVPAQAQPAADAVISVGVKPIRK